jgi:hypothetical protein
MIKKILISFLFIFIVSCGFQPMLKDFDVSSLVIKQINYTGKNEFNYMLQNNLNLNQKPNSEGFIVNLTTSESISSVTKDTAGITTEEQITISVGLNVQDHMQNTLLTDTVSESSRLQVTSNLGTDDTNINIVRQKIITNLAQKIKFKLMILSKR